MCAAFGVESFERGAERGDIVVEDVEPVHCFHHGSGFQVGARGGLKRRRGEKVGLFEVTAEEAWARCRHMELPCDIVAL